MNFSNFNLSDETKRAVEDQGFTSATEIQEKSMPLILDGCDIVGQSQTGSGKTAAYGLPAVERINPALNAKYPQVLVLCPTRELAIQVTDELCKFSKYKERIHIVALYGGQPINKQVAAIRSGCQIIVGTPGRIIDLLGRKVLDFRSVGMVILDEADEMLDMGFREDIESILSRTSNSRQTLLFSATMPDAIKEITGKYQKNPITVEVKSGRKTANNIEQSFFEVARGHKKDVLSLLLQYYRPSLSIVFCNTKKMVDEVTADLKVRGFNAEGLHGDMKQPQRTQVMNRFKNGGFDILVATDVAARGIDVNDIDIVFNYDLPDDSEYYIHRIGRTARAGKTGRSFTLISGTAQLSALRKIEAYTKSEIARNELPTVAMIKAQAADGLVSEILDYASNVDVSDSVQQLSVLRASGLTDGDIAAVLLSMLSEGRLVKSGTVDVPPEEITEQKPREKQERVRNRVRTPNERAQKKFESIPMERVTISIGRNDKVAPKHILGAVAGESGLPGSIMGTIDIRNSYTTIDVPKQFRTRIVKSLNKKTVKGKVVTVK